jgi:diguanylate cyclase (GGDEF)-like protein
MAEIPPSGASSQAGAVTPSAGTAGTGYGGYGSGQPRNKRAPSLRHVFSDIASVLGIPERKLTPEVQNALNSMVAEMDRLRGEIEQRDQRMKWLEEQADRHAWLPGCFNRRAFLRELTRLKGFSERSGIAGSLARFDIRTCDELRGRFGLAVSDLLLAQVTQTLITQVRGTDVVGCLGGPCLAVVMPQATQDQAIHKINSIMDQLGMRLFEWEGERIPLQIAWKAQAFMPGEPAEEALLRCDPAV